MGYITEFFGGFSFNKEVDPETVRFINQFAFHRHMKRNVEKIKEIFPNWKELCFHGDLGVDGEYFIGGEGFMGQVHDLSIIDYNRPGGKCPDLWCHWIIKDGVLKWNGAEKFGFYVEWLQYLIERFFEPGGYILSGTVEYQGEHCVDHGFITIQNNHVEVKVCPSIPLMMASAELLIEECKSEGKENSIGMPLYNDDGDLLSLLYTFPIEKLKKNSGRKNMLEEKR